jgi:TPR repeat protein
MYKNGIGVHQSYEKAAMYFKLAAEQGHPRAISYLSMFYELGLGVTKDLRLAREYFEKSASLGFEFSE